MYDKDRILEPLFYTDSLTPFVKNKGTIRNYLNEIIRKSNEKNIPYNVSMTTMYERGILTEGIYAYRSMPLILGMAKETKGFGRQDWGIMVVQKRPTGFFYATFAHLLKLNPNDTASKKGSNLVALSNKKQYKTQVKLFKEKDMGEILVMSNSAAWNDFKPLKDNLVVCTTTPYLIKVYTPLRLGEMMNWIDF